jgi:hypothetical protein
MAIKAEQPHPPKPGANNHVHCLIWAQEVTVALLQCVKALPTDQRIHVDELTLMTIEPVIGRDNPGCNVDEGCIGATAAGEASVADVIRGLELLAKYLHAIELTFGVPHRS